MGACYIQVSGARSPLAILSVGVRQCPKNDARIAPSAVEDPRRSACPSHVPDVPKVDDVFPVHDIHLPVHVRGGKFTREIA